MPIFRTRSAPLPGALQVPQAPNPWRQRSSQYAFSADRDHFDRRTRPNTPESPTLRIPSLQNKLRRSADAWVLSPFVTMTYDSQLEFSALASLNRTITPNVVHTSDNSVHQSSSSGARAVDGVPSILERDELQNSSSFSPTSAVSSDFDNTFAIGDECTLHWNPNLDGAGKPSFDNIDLDVIGEFEPAASTLRKAEIQLLFALNSVNGAGLSETRFRGLFVKCSNCRVYLTRGTAHYHECPFEY